MTERERIAEELAQVRREGRAVRAELEELARQVSLMRDAARVQGGLEDSAEPRPQGIHDN